MLDRQKAYDTIVAHLRRQGKIAALGVMCRYRTKDGLKCAVGVLIPDELYTGRIEGLSADHPRVRLLIPGADAWDEKFLLEAQALHDENYNKESGCFNESAFEMFARDWGLVYTPPA